MAAPDKLLPGNPYPLGASWDGLGINFAVFSANAHRIELCLFDPAGRREVLQFLLQLKSQGKAIFLSSHILPEVEQIADHVIIINRGKMVRSGRLQDLLASGGQVEILADRVPRELAQSTLQYATIETTPQGARVLVEAARKRETVEALWAAGCDVVRMNPVKDSLEDTFLHLVGGAS